VSDSPVGNVVDVDVFLAITHTFTGDLDISLSYGGTEIALLQDVGGGADGLTVLLSDDASTSITSVANTTGSPITGVYKPLEPLSTFDGVEGSGSWNLRVVDDFVGDTGTLWIVEIRIIRQ
jgi:subtilisin-like proprotein convertase family protein